MFSFGPITRIPPSGSPFSGLTIYVGLADTGVYNFFGGDAEVDRKRALAANSGTYVFDGSGTHIAQNLRLHPEGGVYTIDGGDDAMFISAFAFEGIREPEMIRVPAEVTSMKILAEPRDMYVSKLPDPNVFEEPRESTTPPRLRRT